MLRHTFRAANATRRFDVEKAAKLGYYKPVSLKSEQENLIKEDQTIFQQSSWTFSRREHLSYSASKNLRPTTLIWPLMKIQRTIVHQKIFRTTSKNDRISSSYTHFLTHCTTACHTTICQWFEFKHDSKI